jgi:hypothetical protein
VSGAGRVGRAGGRGGWALTRRKRHVDGGSRVRRPPRLSVTAPGVQRVQPVLVQRNKEDGRVAEEPRLRAVAVVHVKVDDRYTRAAARSRVGGGQSDVGENAEAHPFVRFRVVPWAAAPTRRRA